MRAGLVLTVFAFGCGLDAPNPASERIQASTTDPRGGSGCDSACQQAAEQAARQGEEQARAQAQEAARRAAEAQAQAAAAAASEQAARQAAEQAAGQAAQQAAAAAAQQAAEAAAQQANAWAAQAAAQEAARQAQNAALQAGEDAQRAAATQAAAAAAAAAARAATQNALAAAAAAAAAAASQAGAAAAGARATGSCEIIGMPGCQHDTVVAECSDQLGDELASCDWNITDLSNLQSLAVNCQEQANTSAINVVDTCSTSVAMNPELPGTTDWCWIYAFVNCYTYQGMTPADCDQAARFVCGSYPALPLAAEDHVNACNNFGQMYTQNAQRSCEVDVQNRLQQCTDNAAAEYGSCLLGGGTPL